jgi:hypothetical protein
VPRRSKSRHNSVSFHDDSKANDADLNSVNQGNDKNELHEKLNEIASKGKSNICDKYKVGKCPHGFKGTKLIDNKPCPKSHPPKCNKYLRFGSKGAKGCKKGKDCKYFHPILCKFSVRNKTCFEPECSYPHLKGTQRDPKKQRTNSQQRANSTQPPLNRTDKPKFVEKTDPPTSENHFLELKKMVIQMTTKIQAMETRIDQYQMIPKPPIPHHSFMSSPPHNMSQLHPYNQSMQAVSPAFYTPQFSS